MPAERFYTDQTLEGTVSITGNEHHHLATVMRKKVGDEVELVNGRGALARAKVQTIAKRETHLHILESKEEPIPSPTLILAIPFMRTAKLELVIEKCTELGADAFYLYVAEHSEKKDLSEHQKERLHTIEIAAMKQCGRLDLPKIKIFPSLKALLEEEKTFFFGDVNPSTNNFSPEKGPIVFITGPEKGFSQNEQKLLEKKAIGISLNKYILRAETAPIAATCFYINK